MGKEIMSTGTVVLDAEVASVEDAVNMLAKAMDMDGRLNGKEGYVADVLKRETLSSTAIGFLVATPHAKSGYVLEPTLAFARLKDEIKWDDHERVNLVFLVAVPSPGTGDKHLEILGSLFRKIVHEEFREELMAAETAEEVVKLIGIK